MSTFNVPPTAPALPVLATALPANTANSATATSAVESHSFLLNDLLLSWGRAGGSSHRPRRRTHPRRVWRGGGSLVSSSLSATPNRHAFERTLRSRPERG